LLIIKILFVVLDGITSDYQRMANDNFCEKNVSRDKYPDEFEIIIY